jgi:hypothetical protein
VRNRTSSRSAWIKASPVRSHCESTPARTDLRGGIHYTLYPIHVISNQRVRGSSTFQSSEETANKWNWPSTRETQTGERVERGGLLHEDSGVYERRDRAEVGLGKGEFVSHRWGGW